MLPIGDVAWCTSKRRVIVRRDKSQTSREDQGDHMFVMWGNHKDYDFSDTDAECPFKTRKDGSLPKSPVARPGFITFKVNLYDHSGLHFSLEGNPAGGSDPGGYDTTYGAAYLYITKERFIRFQTEERWMHVPTDPGWGEPWRKAHSMAEFKNLTLRTIAQQEVDELNLIADGQCYRFDVEEAETWTKTYDSDGRIEQGCDWVNTAEGGGGYLTEHADDIEFPRDPDTPVYFADDVCLLSDTGRGLESYEYTIPEHIIQRPVKGEQDRYQYYCGCCGRVDGSAIWSADREAAKVFKTWCDANYAAKTALRTDEPYSIVEKDNWDVKKARKK